jgi:ribosomal protein S18 acetylase RimI-like enzyme
VTETKIKSQIKQFDGECSTAYVLFADGKWASHAEVRDEGQFYSLEDVSTVEKFRRRGFMRQLLLHIKAECQNREFRLIVAPDNHEAIVLYLELGFVFTGDDTYRQTLKERGAEACIPPVMEMPEMVWASGYVKEN